MAQFREIFMAKLHKFCFYLHFIDTFRKNVIYAILVLPLVRCGDYYDTIMQLKRECVSCTDVSEDARRI